MTKEQFEKLLSLAHKNNLPVFEISVAFHIAMDQCKKLATVQEYGTKACKSIERLAIELNSK